MLESNPQYDIARRQMKGGSGMLSFDVKGGLEAGKRFINSLKLCTLAVSLGDTETLVEQAAPHGPPHPHPCCFPLLTITEQQTLRLCRRVCCVLTGRDPGR